MTEEPIDGDVIEGEPFEPPLIKNDPVPLRYRTQEETPKMGAISTLTDGTGISDITGSKVLKDFVADALMGAAAGLLAVNIGGVDAALAAPAVAAVAIANAVISAGYRVVLRWADSS